MTITPLGHLSQGHLATQEPDTTWREYRTLIEDALTNQPRTLQTRIGPSELGNPCDRCLILKLGGTEETRDVAWLPFVGTAVHGELEGIFAQANAGLESVRWLVESQVSVGTVGGVDITGHADLFDLATGEVTDWKIVGKSTLTKVKANGPTPTYRQQAHLYGRGFTRRGLQVNRVRIAFLPRNEPSLAGAHIWSEPYDESIALAALARADMFATAIAMLGLDTVLAQAPPHVGTEFSCARFPSADGSFLPKPGHKPASSDLTGLLAPTAPAASRAGSTTAA